MPISDASTASCRSGHELSSRTGCETWADTRSSALVGAAPAAITSVGLASAEAPTAPAADASAAPRASLLGKGDEIVEEGPRSLRVVPERPRDRVAPPGLAVGHGDRNVGVPEEVRRAPVSAHAALPGRVRVVQQLDRAGIDRRDRRRRGPPDGGDRAVADDGQRLGLVRSEEQTPKLQ